jgi:hypothetical protein
VACGGPDGHYVRSWVIVPLGKACPLKGGAHRSAECYVTASLEPGEGDVDGIPVVNCLRTIAPAAAPLFLCYWLVKGRSNFLTSWPCGKQRKLRNFCFPNSAGRRGIARGRRSRWSFSSRFGDAL